MCVCVRVCARTTFGTDMKEDPKKGSRKIRFSSFMLFVVAGEALRHIVDLSFGSSNCLPSLSCCREIAGISLTGSRSSQRIAGRSHSRTHSVIVLVPRVCNVGPIGLESCT